VRGGLVSVIFRKAMALSAAGRKSASQGQVTNLMSVDCQKLTDIWAVLYNLITAPLSIIVSFVLIWLQVLFCVLTVGLIAFYK
jgi:ATP-binding cassette subfamily C (CFTR/MRP) protein 1